MPSNIQNERLAISLAQLDQLTNWERRPRGNMRVDLGPMLDLVQRVGNPHCSFRSVHVAGTKGKGSTSALIEAGLCRAGIKVGRYASPHLFHVSERISLDGKPVGEEILAEALDATLAAFKAAAIQGTHGKDATWFDLLTISAFLIFKSERVEWAVIETGLGGRLDSTNIVQSDVAVITNIELEHTEVLGSTRAAIAYEKAGIIKSSSAVITPLSKTDEAGSVIACRAQELGCSIARPGFPPEATILARNTEIAKAALDAIGTARSENSAGSMALEPVSASLLNERTIEAARLPGRMDVRKVATVRSHGVTATSVVFDGAHVPFNLRAVLTDLSKIGEFKSHCTVVMAIAEDKDAVGLISEISSDSFSVIFTAAGARSRDPDDLKQMADAIGIRAIATRDPGLAYKNALQTAAASGGWVLVTGSLYLVGRLIET